MTPTATYRFQLGPDQTFETVARAAPHLARLGVSHAYLSPVLQAVAGSTHGYDVIDHGRISAELGGITGLRGAAQSLRAHGIGLVLDVVPNHMAIPVPESANPVLWSALAAGPDSVAARWFDVDWAAGAGRIVLPTLGRPIDACLDAGEILVDARTCRVRYFSHEFPVREGTEHLPLDELLEGQHYRLAYWRVADLELNYRRFFDVDSLIAIRVEIPEVFEASHSVLLELVRDGTVDGLRIDHPDGLADPREYLENVRAATATAPARPWIVVEKILVHGEELPDDWNCDGTTGYDAIGPLDALFVEPAGARQLAAACAAFTDSDATWEDAVEQSRRDVVSRLFAPEIERLTALAVAACRSHVRDWDHSEAGLAKAITEVLIAFDVYRAYVRPGEQPTVTAERTIERAADRASSRHPAARHDFDIVAALALGRLGRGPAADEFCVRFQQTTGPVMAKGVEDTASYRWMPLSALDEVGGRPDLLGIEPDRFHDWAGKRLATGPGTMNAASTHDTKRSADVRARLLALSEAPGAWISATERLGSSVGRFRADEPGTDQAAPRGTLSAEQADATLGWLCFQTVVGAWPIEPDRLTAYLLKAAREAKLRTSWIDPDPRYEAAIGAYVGELLADPRAVSAIEDLVGQLHPGFVANLMGRRAIQAFVPGIPDIYQGDESVALALVDPDNRRRPDFDALEATLERGLGSIPEPVRDPAAAKARLTATALRLRRERPDLFDGTSSYEPIVTTGPHARHVVGFARRGRRGRPVAVLVTRFALTLADSGGWDANTSVGLPEGLWHDVLVDGVRQVGAHGAGASELLGSVGSGGWPIALLVQEG